MFYKQAKTLFLVVDRNRGKGEIALYNQYYKKFVRAGSSRYDPVTDYGPMEIEELFTSKRKGWTSTDWIEKPIGNGKIALFNAHKKKFIRTYLYGGVSFTGFFRSGVLPTDSSDAMWYVNMGALAAQQASFSSFSGCGTKEEA